MDLYDKYFNNTLRNYLKYPEKFNITISKNRVTLTPDQPSSLLKLLKTDSSIVSNIISSLKSGLKNTNIEDVYFSTHGDDIVINVVFSKVIVNLDTGLWATLASYLDVIDMYKLLQVDLDFIRIFKSVTFWTELIRQRFPQYYAPLASGYDWEILYANMIKFDEIYQESINRKTKRLTRLFDPNIYSAKYYELFEYLRNQPEVTRYFVLNDLLIFDRDNLMAFIEVLCRKLNMELFHHLLERYQVDRDLLVYIFNTCLVENNSDIIEYLLGYSWKDPETGKIIEINQSDISSDNISAGRVLSFFRHLIIIKNFKLLLKVYKLTKGLFFQSSIDILKELLINMNEMDIKKIMRLNNLTKKFINNMNFEELLNLLVSHE